MFLVDDPIYPVLFFLFFLGGGVLQKYLVDGTCPIYPVLVSLFVLFYKCFWLRNMFYLSAKLAFKSRSGFFLCDPGGRSQVGCGSGLFNIGGDSLQYPVVLVFCLFEFS